LLRWRQGSHAFELSRGEKKKKTKKKGGGRKRAEIVQRAAPHENERKKKRNGPVCPASPAGRKEESTSARKGRDSLLKRQQKRPPLPPEGATPGGGRFTFLREASRGRKRKRPIFTEVERCRPGPRGRRRHRSPPGEEEGQCGEVRRTLFFCRKEKKDVKHSAPGISGGEIRRRKRRISDFTSAAEERRGGGVFVLLPKRKRQGRGGETPVPCSPSGGKKVRWVRHFGREKGRTWETRAKRRFDLVRGGEKENWKVFSGKQTWQGKGGYSCLCCGGKKKEGKPLHQRNPEVSFQGERPFFILRGKVPLLEGHSLSAGEGGLFFCHRLKKTFRGPR